MKIRSESKLGQETTFPGTAFLNVRLVDDLDVSGARRVQEPIDAKGTQPSFEFNLSLSAMGTCHMLAAMF